MAQRQIDELVDDIRLRRHRIGRALGHPQLPADLRSHVQRHPLPWMLGGIVVGTLSLPLLVPILLRSSRGVARHWMRRSFQGATSQLVLTALGRIRSAAPNEFLAVWENASPTDQEPPLQASGGPVQPLSTP